MTKRVMHIDTSTRFYQKGATGIAFKIIDSNLHSGIVLSSKAKKELRQKLRVEKNYPKLYAILIYFLIRDYLKEFDLLIICNDESFSEVKVYLDKIFESNIEYSKKEITSISQYRKIIGDSKIRSHADKIANNYRRKGIKNGVRQQRGIQLNISSVSYDSISNIWKENM